MVKGFNYNMVVINDNDTLINGEYGITPADVMTNAHPLIIRIR